MNEEVKAGTSAEAAQADLEDYKLQLADQIIELRGRNVQGDMRCRALSECITCLETAYLWLCQVPGDGVRFAPEVKK
jgi:hypothetical protein